MAKEKIICDTDVLIDYFDKNKSRNASVTALLETDIELDNVIIFIHYQNGIIVWSH